MIPTSVDALLPLVLEELEFVLPGTPIQGTTPLTSLSAFDSVALVDLISRLEARLGGTIPADHILPEAFATPREIARMLAEIVPDEAP